MTHGQIMEKLAADGIRIGIIGSDLDIRSDRPLTDNHLEYLKRNKSKLISELRSKAEDDSKLITILTSVTIDLPITPMEVRNALDPEEIEDWRKGGISIESLAAFANALVIRKQINRGEVPDLYTERATCKHCGPVWLWITCEVLGCPWCWNRAAGRPIPHPQSVHCEDCIHFERIEHPNLGHCAKDEPEAAAGLWDTDKRYCEMYLPQPQRD